jgi:L-serine dehydratase
VKPSIFNDVIGPVMRGASSSHCAAALRIGLLARDLMKGDIEKLLVEFDTGGSLPTTHRGQGSDMGLFGGLLGWSADDERLPDSATWIDEQGVRVDFRYRDLADPHPNTYRLTLRNAREERRLTAISTGGGMIEIIGIDDARVSIHGDYEETLAWYPASTPLDPVAIRDASGADHCRVIRAGDSTLLQIQGQRCLERAELERLAGAPDRFDRLHAVLPVRSRRDMRLPFSNAGEFAEYLARAGGPGAETPLWKLALDYESARSGLAEEDLIERMKSLAALLRRSIEQGVAGTEHADRILGAQSPGYLDAMERGRLLDAGLMNRAILYTSALMEVKSAMGVIVAAPTAGACAALPAACLAAAENLGLSEEETARGLLAAGLVGVFIASDWTFAAEVGGCQAEGGAAAAMAAAALVDFTGGGAERALAAASMALQNTLGMICDPVANRVEVPCLGRNVLAASNALACANLALAGFDEVIPLDETIKAMDEVGKTMPHELRCTALGGLSTTETSKRIQKDLEEGGQ